MLGDLGVNEDFLAVDTILDNLCVDRKINVIDSETLEYIIVNFCIPAAFEATILGLIFSSFNQNNSFVSSLYFFQFF